MSIGQRIVELRNQRSLSQNQLAAAMGVSRQAVSKWENDLASPDTVKLIQLAEVLGTDVEYLATGGRISSAPTAPTVITVVETVEKIVEKEVEVEKLVEIEKIVEVEKVVETIVEKPVIRKIRRIKYLRNPVEFAGMALGGFLIGLIVGLLL